MGNGYLRIPTLWEQGARSLKGQKAISAFGTSFVTRASFLQEETFHNLLTLERRRAERSRKPFVLMVLECDTSDGDRLADRFLSQVTSVLLKSTRETDLVGWYKNGASLGVIFTEISLEYATPITEILRAKVVKALQNELSGKIISKLAVTVHLFPESRDRDGAATVADIRLYPDLQSGDSKKHVPRAIKRAIDIVGSGVLLLFLSPLLAAIALAIKLTSKGPVLFRQERLGQFGASFKCLKFRTMNENNDPKIHREYIQRFIAGQSGAEDAEHGKPVVYKLTNDPRVTTVGKFLRKTSLDEFPQFWNVLRGEMSLVGPRPPVPYEFEAYDIWHRRRVLELQPGVTGLWQVSGRSRMCFDDMVRLDLRYSQSWSLWLDLKVLIATPRAVLGGEGAY